MRSSLQRLLIAPGVAPISDAIVPACRVLRTSPALPGELLDLFQEREFGRAKNPSFLQPGSQLVTLTKLVGLLQIPLEQQDHIIGVIGATEDLSPFGTSGLAVGVICIKDQLPPRIVRDGVFDKQV